MNKDIGKWCEFHKIPWHNTYECRLKQLLVVELKDSTLEVGSESESDIEKGNHVIDAKHIYIVATTKVHLSELE
jgi:hypothetical protein